MSIPGFLSHHAEIWSWWWWECLWWRGSVCLLLYLQATTSVHLYSGDSALGMESLAELGVSARMDNCLANSCELPASCILRVTTYFKTYMHLSFDSLNYNLWILCSQWSETDGRTLLSLEEGKCTFRVLSLSMKIFNLICFMTSLA